MSHQGVMVQSSMDRMGYGSGKLKRSTIHCTIVPYIEGVPKRCADLKSAQPSRLRCAFRSRCLNVWVPVRGKGGHGFKSAQTSRLRCAFPLPSVKMLVPRARKGGLPLGWWGAGMSEPRRKNSAVKMIFQEES